MTLADEVMVGLLPMTCARDGLNHMVADEQFLQGRQSGLYSAVCGHSVQVCSLWTTGKRCPQCRGIGESLRLASDGSHTATRFRLADLWCSLTRLGARRVCSPTAVQA